MPKYCVVQNCTNFTGAKSHGTHMFRLLTDLIKIRNSFIAQFEFVIDFLSQKNKKIYGLQQSMKIMMNFISVMV